MGELLPVLSLLLCLSLLQGAQAATFTVSNQCGYTVWPGILSNAGVAPPSTTGFALSPGQTLAVSVAAAWSGRIWGRTLCGQDSSGRFTCATGDCGSGAGACPRAYSYAYDDATSTFTCAAAGGGYDVVFCPGASSNPEAVGVPPTYSTIAFTGNAESLATSRVNLLVIFGLVMVISSAMPTLPW
uniref:Thaumatin-like protein n=1 Tax=Oryza brachyantha TaxID=4533 RepID=J3MHP0_ORYBR